MERDVIDQLRATLSERAEERGIEYAGRWATWGEIGCYGDKLASMLDATGCPPHARVAIVIRNRVTHAAAFVGLLAHRRSISFIYPFLPASAMEEHLADLDAAVIVADEQDWPAFRDTVAARGLAGIALTDLASGPRLVPGLETCTASIPAAEGSAEGSIAVLSSGTTGTPKRIPMSLSLLERAVMSAPGGESGAPPEVQINIWPLAGVGGVCLLSASAVHGTPHVLIERFTVEALVDAVQRHRPSTLGLNPTAIAMIMDANVPLEDMASVRSISGGSAHLAPELQERFEERYGIPILWGMGATEFCGTIVRWTPQLRDEFGNSKRGSVGRAMPGVSLRAVDPETGDPLPPGAEGLLEVHCPVVRPDWVRTTDLAVIDEDGFVFHHGRYDGAIVRGGFKILPERVVDVLRRHPSVADASVVGVVDARLGAVPVAAVELRAGAPRADAEELIAWVRETLPPTHVPAQIRIVDALPRTPSLKVSLRDIKQLFETSEV